MGCKTSTVRGTTYGELSINNTAGISKAPNKITQIIRFKSNVLAKRQMPRYKPKLIKKTTCTGKTHKIDNHIEGKYSGGI